MITPDTLDAAVEFDVPFTVGANGEVETPVTGVYAPEVYHVEGVHSPGDISIGGTDWEALTGYTGQHGYHGAVMHASEYLGGRMAADVLATPGTYVLVAVEVMPEDDDDEPEPAGWALLRRTS